MLKAANLRLDILIEERIGTEFAVFPFSCVRDHGPEQAHDEHCLPVAGDYRDKLQRQVELELKRGLEVSDNSLGEQRRVLGVLIFDILVKMEVGLLDVVRLLDLGCLRRVLGLRHG